MFTGTEGGAFAIDISSRTAEIRGVVTDDQSHPVAGIPVVLIPDRHRDRFELYTAATTDANGRYSLRSVSPDDYKLFALEAVDVNDWFDPDFVKRIEIRGKPLHLLESSDPVMDLKVISEN
ncbi:MAG TPA: carboxypeptidase-like regulatory domain-containing protein [Terriglobia bacterium]|nr:carboxypeptidase-like regulatory domain-containing protein [Terriglobia bacterium]